MSSISGGKTKGESKLTRVAGKHYIARIGIKVHQVNLNIFLVVFLVGSVSEGLSKRVSDGVFEMVSERVLVGSGRHEREEI